jgi:hypothetical protein
MMAMCGAVRMTRGAETPQAGQSEGSALSAIGLKRSNGPQSEQIYP